MEIALETLSIRNFITISEADIVIKSFNVLIGQQSTGKSLIAKLLYFFKSDVPSAMLSVIKDDAESSSTEYDNSSKFKRKFDKKLTESFTEIFNPAYWGSKDFYIKYSNDDHEIILSRADKDGRKVKIEVSPNFRADFIKLKMSYRDYLKSREGVPEFFRDDVALFIQEFFSEIPNREGFNFYISHSFFVPAGRGFFALLEENIFSFLSVNSTIDRFIKNFGVFYGNAKRFYTRRNRDEKVSTIRGFNEEVDKIVGGKLTYSNRSLVISQKNGITIKLESASSGQQEVVPMLISLSFMSRIRQFGRGSPSLFIEEPEAHLFPKTQKDVVYAISALHNKLNLTTFITTHSPYVLAAVNNLVISGIAQSSIGGDKELSSKLDGIIARNLRIRKDSLSAYFIDYNGNVRSIISDEGVIGVNSIDEISEEISKEFYEILEFIY